MQELALSRTRVQVNIITTLRSLPRKELELLNFRCFTTVAEEVLSSKFGLDSFDKLHLIRKRAGNNIHLLELRSSMGHRA